MAQTNNINNRSSNLTIDPGAASDSYIQFDVNAANKFIVGVDTLWSNAYEMSVGNALGTNDTFIMTTSGELNLPMQPASLSLKATNTTNITGAATTYTLGTAAFTEIFDQNGDMTTGMTWTAPVTGCYYFTMTLRISGITAAMTDGYLEIITSNRTFTGSYWNPGAVATNLNQAGFHLTAMADMEAADTATFTLTISNGAGDTADLDGVATHPISWINAFLIA